MAIGRHPVRILLSFPVSVSLVAAFGSISPAVAREVTGVPITDTYTERVIPTVRSLVPLTGSTHEPAIPVLDSSSLDLSSAIARAVELAFDAQAAQLPVNVAPHLTDAHAGSLQKRLILLPLCVSLAGLQLYDVYSTVTALNRGFVEGNPVMIGLTGHPLALAGVKAATSTTMIYTANRLWNHHHRTAAIALIGISNAVAALVATNNAAALQRVR
jgi:uncharacterized protein DUF5658